MSYYYNKETHESHTHNFREMKYNVRVHHDKDTQ